MLPRVAHWCLPSPEFCVYLFLILPTQAKIKALDGMGWPVETLKRFKKTRNPSCSTHFLLLFFGRFHHFHGIPATECRCCPAAGFLLCATLKPWLLLLRNVAGFHAARLAPRAVRSLR